MSVGSVVTGPVQDVIDAATFRDGLLAGLAATGVVGALGIVCRLRHRRPLPVAAVAAAAAALVGLSAGDMAAPDDVVTATAVAFALVALAEMTRRPWLVPLAAVPGALLAAGTVPDARPGWVAAAAAGAVVAASLAGTSASGRIGAAVGPAALLVTVGGIYSTVPDTERALVLLGVAAPLAVLGWPVALARSTGAGYAAMAVVAGHVVVTDGAPRDGSMVGGLVAIGLIGIVAVLARVAGVERLAERRFVLACGLWLAVLLVATVAVTRVGGLEDDAGSAAAVAAVVLVAGIVVALSARLALRRRAAPEPEPTRTA